MFSFASLYKYNSNTQPLNPSFKIHFYKIHNLRQRILPSLTKSADLLLNFTSENTTLFGKREIHLGFFNIITKNIIGNSQVQEDRFGVSLAKTTELKNRKWRNLKHFLTNTREKYS